MLPICYLFFMSLSAGVALLQPTLLSATDELVKPEERPLEVTQEAVVMQPAGLLKEQEKKEQVHPKPAGPSGLGYVMVNGIGNLIKLVNVTFLASATFRLVVIIFHKKASLKKRATTSINRDKKQPPFRGKKL